MKKNFIVIIISVAIIILILSSLFVYANNNSNNKTEDLKSKVSKEIKYLNSYFISLLGNFNGLTIGEEVFQLNPEEKELEKQSISDVNESNKTSGNDSQSETSTDKQSSNAQNKSSQNRTSGESEKMQNSILANNGKYDTNWSEIKIQIEQLYSIWNTVSLDLHALNIDGNSILNFSDILNSATQYIKKSDKEKSIIEIGKLHALLPQYMNGYNIDEREKQILNIEVKVVSSYINVSNDNWEEASNNINLAEQNFSNIINTVSKENNPKQAVMNQCYILINEIKNAVNLKDKDIFYIQYQNLITKMGILF